jgi:murein L,D-transpeptidase YafK
VIRGLAAFLWLPLAAMAQPADRVYVDKSERRLYLMSGGKVLRQFRIALGGSPVGHKQQEG